MATNKELAAKIVNRLFHHKDSKALTLLELVIMDADIDVNNECSDNRKELVVHLENYENKYLQKVWSMVQWATK